LHLSIYFPLIILSFKVQSLFADQLLRVLPDRLGLRDDVDLGTLLGIAERIAPGTLHRVEKERIELQNKINRFLDGFT
jgi:hypothetical protein